MWSYCTFIVVVVVIAVVFWCKTRASRRAFDGSMTVGGVSRTNLVRDDVTMLL